MFRNKTGQSAIEFVVIFGFVLFFFISFFTIIQGNQSEKNKEKEKTMIQNIALDIEDEINLAAQSSEGYYREFNLPSNIMGKEYYIEIVNDSIYVHSDDFGVSYLIFDVQGALLKGENNISKKNGKVYLNQ